MAILRATKNICMKADTKFQEPKTLDPKELAKACKKEAFGSNFEIGIKMITYHNVMTDLTHASDEEFHFDSERFKDGKQLITSGLKNIEDSLMKNKFDDARERLGQIMHTLQDFYSHSNWIELGYTEPCTALINPDDKLPNLADKATKTCEESSGKTSNGAKLLKSIIEKKILTSGYFGGSKPIGKCSHGGTWDFTTGIGKGADGINKDYDGSSHGKDHDKASEVAIAATMQLLDKIWKSVNQKDKFFSLVGLQKDKPSGEWKTYIPVIDFKSRYKDAKEGNVNI